MAKTKGNPLAAALGAVSESAPDEPREVSPAPEPTKTSARQPRARPDRSKTVMIGGHFSKSYKQQLRIIAAEEDTTSQALLEEALNLLFVKKGKERIL